MSSLWLVQMIGLCRIHLWFWSLCSIPICFVFSKILKCRDSTDLKIISSLLQSHGRACFAYTKDTKVFHCSCSYDGTWKPQSRVTQSILPLTRPFLAAVSFGSLQDLHPAVHSQNNLCLSVWLMLLWSFFLSFFFFNRTRCWWKHLLSFAFLNE